MSNAPNWNAEYDLPCGVKDCGHPFSKHATPGGECVQRIGTWPGEPEFCQCSWYSSSEGNIVPEGDEWTIIDVGYPLGPHFETKRDAEWYYAGYTQGARDNA